jgi:hypothetical protein
LDASFPISSHSIHLFFNLSHQDAFISFINTCLPWCHQRAN